MWRALDPEQKQEVSERAFFSFLREKKILTEKKQVDEMLRQCLFLKKGEEATIGATVPFTLYQRLFAKPLMLLGVENVLSLIEDSAHQQLCREQGAHPASVSPKRAAAVPSKVGPMAVIDFHRKYMKHVFTSDELEQYEKFKHEARRVRKQQKARQHLDPRVNAAAVERNMDPLKRLEDYKAAKAGLEELRPFGIDKTEAVKVMSLC